MSADETTTRPETPRASGYRPELDGLRALAVVPILLFHAKLGCPGGFVGVDVFFVLSGYLITSLIQREQRDGTFRLFAFWERRILRIVPALALVVLATIVAGWFFFLPDDFRMLGKSVVAQSTLLSNAFFYNQARFGGGYFAPGSEAKTLLHTWSLAVEEQFYLFFPPLLILLARHRAFSTIKTIASLTAVSFALSVVGSYSFPLATFYLLPTRAWELLLGALAAMARGRIGGSPATREAAGWAGVGLIICAICFYGPETRFPGLAAIPPCLGAFLIILVNEPKLSLAGRMLAWKPVVFVGLISYSLYLWHWPLMVFARYYESINTGRSEPVVAIRVALLAVAGGLAVLSWKYVEAPFRKRWILRRRHPIFGFAGAVTVAMLMLGLVLVLGQGLPSRFSGRSYSYLTTRNHRDFLRETDVEEAESGRFPGFGSAQTNQPIDLLVWGDSHAMAVTPVLDTLCRRYSWRGIQATRPGTAPILGYASTNQYSLMDQAPVFSKAILNFIAQNHIKNVLMAGFWNHYLTSDSTKAQTLETVQAIMNAGARVYFLKDVPEQVKDLARVTARAVLHNDDLEMIGATLEEYQKANRELEGTLGNIERMGATVLDPSVYFLNQKGLYGVVKDDHVLYCDSDHLTVEGAQLLAPLFEPIFHRH